MSEGEDIAATDSLVARGDGGTAAAIGNINCLSLPPPLNGKAGAVWVRRNLIMYHVQCTIYYFSDARRAERGRF